MLADLVEHVRGAVIRCGEHFARGRFPLYVWSGPVPTCATTHRVHATAVCHPDPFLAIGHGRRAAARAAHTVWMSGTPRHP